MKAAPQSPKISTREARAAEALRANLVRRKAQQQARREKEAESEEC